MLNDEKLRERYNESAEELARLEEERAIQADLLSYYARLMAARGITPNPPQARTPLAPAAVARPVTAKASAPSTRGSGISPTSVRGTVLAVLRESKEPLHSKDIADRVRAAGVSLGGKDKTSVVDLALLSLSRRGLPITKVAPRTWRWSEEK